MRMHKWPTISILWLLLLLYQWENSHAMENNPSKSQKINTYRSSLEKSIQSAVGLTNYLTRPLQHISNNNSTKKFNDGGFGNILNRFKDEIHAIVPGTRWCGDGDIAANDNDVGIFYRTDSCCRQHDKCDFNIESGKTLGNLKNDGLFTRSACECDRAFYNCLKDAHNTLSSEIGHMYFTILAPQCITYDHPIVSCKKSKGIIFVVKKCIEYEYDTSKPKTLQWMDNPIF